MPDNQVKYELTQPDLLTETQYKDQVTLYHDPYEACRGSHCVMIITEWDEFKTYDYQRIYDNMIKPAFLFDGR